MQYIVTLVDRSGEIMRSLLLATVVATLNLCAVPVRALAQSTDAPPSNTTDVSRTTPSQGMSGPFSNTTGTTASVETPAPEEAAFELVCHGQGSHVQVGLSALLAFSGNRSAQGIGVSRSNVQGADAVRVRIQGQNSAVRLPRDLYASKLHNSTVDGWLKLIQLETSATEIKGKIDLFFTSHPQVRIDRDTGDIEINGNGDFAYAGSCEKVAADAPRKF